MRACAWPACRDERWVRAQQGTIGRSCAYGDGTAEGGAVTFGSEFCGQGSAARRLASTDEHADAAASASTPGRSIDLRMSRQSMSDRRVRGERDASRLDRCPVHISYFAVGTENLRLPGPCRRPPWTTIVVLPLLFAGEIDEASVGKSTIMMTADADKDQEAGGFPVRAAKYEMWSGSIDPDMVKAIMASRSLHVRRTTPMPDEKVDVAKFDIDLTGLASMRTQLAAACSSVDANRKVPGRQALGQQLRCRTSPRRPRPCRRRKRRSARSLLGAHRQPPAVHPSGTPAMRMPSYTRSRPAR